MDSKNLISDSTRFKGGYLYQRLDRSDENRASALIESDSDSDNNSAHKTIFTNPNMQVGNNIRDGMVSVN